MNWCQLKTKTTLDRVVAESQSPSRPPDGGRKIVSGSPLFLGRGDRGANFQRKKVGY